MVVQPKQKLTLIGKPHDDPLILFIFVHTNRAIVHTNRAICWDTLTNVTQPRRANLKAKKWPFCPAPISTKPAVSFEHCPTPPKPCDINMYRQIRPPLRAPRVTFMMMCYRGVQTPKEIGQQHWSFWKLKSSQVSSLLTSWRYVSHNHYVFRRPARDFFSFRLSKQNRFHGNANQSVSPF